MGEVSWIYELDVREGQLEPLRRLMERMVATTRADEPGARIYAWSLSEDGRRCHIHEHYAGPEAALLHLRTFQREFADAFASVLRPVRMVVYGEPDERLRRALEGEHTRFMRPIGGFMR